MNIGGFQKLTLLDYPGYMAAIVFTKGCNLRCPFCHNSDLVLPSKVDTDLTEDYIFEYLKKRQGILEGVVISGGEPLIQEGIEEFIMSIRQMGYKIKLDTNGTFPHRLEKLIKLGVLDYVAMDIKHMPSSYSLATGIENDRIVEKINDSINILKNSNIEYEFRTTLIKGIHEIEDVDEIAKWISGNSPFYLQSYVDSGNVISPSGLSSFSDNDKKIMHEIAQKHCPQSFLRG